MFSSNNDDWETPKDLYDKLNEEFHFTLDPCCTKETAKCKKFFTKEDDGIKQDWGNETVFCNPPYSSKLQDAFIEKCYRHGVMGNTAVALIPARTDTKRFHDYIYNKAEIRFIRGRLTFCGAINPAPFPSMIVIFGPKRNYKTNNTVINSNESVKILAVDFDGTLCENKFPEIGDPIEKSINYVLEKQYNGWKIILWTCRVNERLNEAIEWCKNQGIIFDAINENLPSIANIYGGDSRKITADEYLDDLSVTPNSL